MTNMLLFQSLFSGSASFISTEAILGIGLFLPLTLFYLRLTTLRRGAGLVPRRSISSAMKSSPIIHDIVLVGGGHAHVHVIRMFGMKDRFQNPDVQLTLISQTIHTPYSGMLPGYVAGLYSYDQIHIDLQRLCKSCNVRFIHTSASQIEISKSGSGSGGMVHCQDGRPPIRFDALSIDIGSAPSAVSSQIADSYENLVVPVKPISNFCSYFDELVQKWESVDHESASQTSTPSKEYRIGVVGGGAGGIEILLAIQHRLKERKSTQKLQMVLITRGKCILEQSHPPKVQHIFQRIFNERNIEVHYECEVANISRDESGRKVLTMKESKATVVLDDCVWCVTAGVASWLQEKTPLATTQAGFIRVQPTYESVSHGGVFAAGDCCHMDRHPRPKAGVFAVRAGPFLRTNLFRYIRGEELKRHVPQKDFLSIISTGNAYAIASKNWYLCMEGSFIWKCKDYIDQKFMNMYTKELPDVEKMMNKNTSTGLFGWFQPAPYGYLETIDQEENEAIHEALSTNPMRCGGCGAKVGSETVSRVLKSVLRRQIQRAKLLGYKMPSEIDHDDAAVVPINNRKGAMIHTIDYFRELVSDPYIFGKIAALHALSDIHAMCAKAESALTLAVTPYAARESITENNLFQMMAGISDVLQDEDIQMIGGHTCEGKELAVGLSVNGYVEDTMKLLRKKGGMVGDKIILTKPIGTGALFAADMRGLANGSHVQEAIQSMLKSNAVASRLAREQTGLHACTDVTGFALLGHLLEMLMANEADTKLDRIGATIHIRRIGFLSGGLDASKRHIYSTLQRENMRTRRAVANHEIAAKTYPIEYPLLYDPQTAGGLLFFCEASSTNNFCEKLQEVGVDARVIGEVISYTDFEADSSEGVCPIGSSSSSGKRINIHL